MEPINIPMPKNQWYHSIQAIFLLISTLFIVFVLITQIYHIQTVNDTIQRKNRQTTAILADAVVGQTREAMNQVFDKSTSVRSHLIELHRRTLALINKNPSLSLQQIQNNYFSNELNFDLYRLNRKMVVVETTYKPDLGLDLSSLRKDFDDLIMTREMGTLNLPIYDPIYYDYTLYSNIYRLSHDDFVEVSIRYDYRKKYKNLSNFLDQVPNLNNVYVYALEPNGSTTEIFRYVNQRNVKNKQTYIRDNAKCGAEIIYILTHSSNTKSQVHEHFSDDTDELVYDKIIEANGGFPKFIIRTIIDTKEEKQQAHELYLLHLTWLIVNIVFVFIMLMLLQRRLIRPIVIMADQISDKTVLSDDFINRYDEIGYISNRYNQTIMDISYQIAYSKQLLENQDKFIRTSIHEINTPLTIISLYSELLQLEIGENSNTKQIEAGVCILKNTFEDLSYLIKKGIDPTKPIEIDFGIFLRERVDFFALVAEVNTKKIDLLIDTDYVIVIDPLALQRLIDNTISNAIKYSHLNTIISIHLTSINDEMVLSIINQGMPIIDIDKIFELYVREDSAKGGYGIGLAIVKEICEEYTIRITVRSDDEQTMFIYTFPETLMRGKNDNIFA
jgi:signal transduction histidine kinase